MAGGPSGGAPGFRPFGQAVTVGVVDPSPVPPVRGAGPGVPVVPSCKVPGLRECSRSCTCATCERAYPPEAPIRAEKRPRCAAGVKAWCVRLARPGPLGTVGGTPGPSWFPCSTRAAAGGFGIDRGAGELRPSGPADCPAEAPWSPSNVPCLLPTCPVLPPNLPCLPPTARAAAPTGPDVSLPAARPPLRRVRGRNAPMHRPTCRPRPPVRPLRALRPLRTAATVR